MIAATSVFGFLAVSAPSHDDVAFLLEARERALRPAVAARVTSGASAGLPPRGVGLAGGAVLWSDGTLQSTTASRSTVVHPSALLGVKDGAFLVGSADQRTLTRYAGADLHDAGVVDVDVDGVSALAGDGNRVYVGSVSSEVVSVIADHVRGRCSVRPDGGHDVRQLIATDRHVLALSALGHVVIRYDVDDAGVIDCASAVVARFESPLFAFAARERGSEEGDVTDVTDVVVSGIEDLPLLRRDGGFFNIDSYAFGLTFDGRTNTVSRTWEQNLSAHDVVTGKAVFADPARHAVAVVARGTRGRVWLDWRTGAVVGEGRGSADIEFAGVGDHGQVVVVDNRAGGVVDDGTASDADDADVSAGDDMRAAELGRRVAFSSLMAPAQRSDGAQSRFTCEACHVDGGIDGRVHNTGRIDDDGHAVTASTKPLQGLFQNPPLFSRALDRSVAVMVHAEFKVANRGTHDPWFAAEGHSPEELRLALLTFFAHFDPPARPACVVDDDVRAGARAFSARCQGCHPARVFTDDEASAVDVEVALAHPRAYVWAREGHADVGIRPRVHEAGARPSSLRDIAYKTPLFTNGQARDVDDAVAAVRVTDHGVVHAGSGTPLAPDEQRALVAFLRCL